MGSSMSKQSSGNTVTTRNQTSENSFQNFRNSLRRSLRAKGHATNASDGPKPRSQLSSSDLSKTPAPESPKVKIPPEEVGKARSILKEAIEAKGREAGGVVNRKAEGIGESIEETVNSELQQVSTFKDDVITNDNKFEGVVDKRLNEAGDKVQTKVNEGRLEARSIFSQLAPADESEEQSPEVEISPKPVTASLLEALEKRKEQKSVVEKRDSSPSSGVSNVLESIAAGTAAVRSQEAADLMVAFTSSLEKTEATSKGVEVDPKVDIAKEEVGKARSILKEAIEAKGKEAEGVGNEKLYEVGENVQRKSEN